MTRKGRRGIAWLELLLGVFPATVLLGMFTPALVVLGAWDRPAAWAILPVPHAAWWQLACGLVGLAALWALLLPVALGRVERPQWRPWIVAGVLVGLLGNSFFVPLLDHLGKQPASLGQLALALAVLAPTFVLTRRVIAWQWAAA